MIKKINQRILLLLLKLIRKFAELTNQHVALFSYLSMNDGGDAIFSEYSIKKIENEDEITPGTVFIANLALIYLKYKQSGVPFLLTFEKLDEIIKEQYPNDETA